MFYETMIPKYKKIIGLNIHLFPIFVDFIQFGPYFRFMFN